MTKFLVPFEYGPIKLFGAIQLVILAVIWMLSPGDLIPTPLEIISAWDKLALKDGLLIELWASSKTIMTALFYSSIISATLAYLAAYSLLRPIVGGLTTLRFLGFAGITYVFTMLTHDGAALKVWLLTFGMTTFLLTNMFSSTLSVTQAEVDYAKTLGLSGPRTVYELLVRGRLADFLDMVRQNAAIGWTLLSMVEGLSFAEGGIGTLLIKQSKYLHLDGIFAIQLTILTYGLVQDYLLGLLRLWVCPHIKYTVVK